MTIAIIASEDTDARAWRRKAAFEALGYKTIVLLVGSNLRWYLLEPCAYTLQGIDEAGPF
jgi:hypothetical protein